VRGQGVVAVNPGHDLPWFVGKGFEVVQPNARFLKRAEEALHDAVLLKDLGGDALLLEAVVLPSPAEGARMQRGAV